MSSADDNTNKNNNTTSTTIPMEVDKNNNDGGDDDHKDGRRVSPSISDAQDCVRYILEHNFDGVTRPCLITCAKILDNVLQKPTDDRVRSIRCSTKTFRNKLSSCRGGVALLLSFGFQIQRQQRRDGMTTMTTDDAPSVRYVSNRGGTGNTNAAAVIKADDAANSMISSFEDCTAILTAGNENTAHLVNCRRLLTKTCVQELRMKPSELPEYRDPVPKPVVLTAPSGNNTDIPNAFDPYRGYRHDNLSAAAGRKVGPDGDYVSATETKVKELRKQQEQLENRLQKQQRQREGRTWVAYRYKNRVPTGSAGGGGGSAGGAVGGGGGDSSLFAERLQKQQEERKKGERFTTRAMRDLEKLQKAKVYSHAVLTVTFPDGCVVVSDDFIPRDTIRSVSTSIVRDCLVPGEREYQFDLVVTPPRKVMDEDQTLEREGLVPAAKIFLSWRDGCTPTPPTTGGAKPGFYVREDLFADETASTAAASTSSSSSALAFPTSEAVAAQLNDGDDNVNKDKNKKKKAAPPSNNREEDMLRRMMGGGGLFGAKKQQPKPDPNGKDKKPKWFK